MGLLLHVLFNYFLFQHAFFLVISYLFSFILISQFHFIARQISCCIKRGKQINGAPQGRNLHITSKHLNVKQIMDFRYPHDGNLL